MYQIFAVSDGSGQTAEGVMRAALTQFDDSLVRIRRSLPTNSSIAHSTCARLCRKPPRRVDLSFIRWFLKKCAMRCSPWGDLLT